MTPRPDLNQLDQAILYAQQLLQNFLIQPNLSEILRVIFGDEAVNFSLDLFTDLPRVTVTTELPDNVRGAYANANKTIYLSDRLIDSDDINAIAFVWLEELGHYLDSQLNATDTTGDEGEVFAARVLGQTLTSSQLARIQTEHDWTTLSLNGQSLSVETSNQLEEFSIIGSSHEMYAYSIEVEDDLAYVHSVESEDYLAYASELIMDISNPAEPNPLSYLEYHNIAGSFFYYSLPRTTQLEIVNNLAYVSQYSYSIEEPAPAILEIIDISNPSSPSLVSSVNLNDLAAILPNEEGHSTASLTEVAHGFAYIISNYDLRVIDISNPLSPSFVGSYDFKHPATPFFGGKTLYNRLPAFEHPARDLEIIGDLAYVHFADDFANFSNTDQSLRLQVLNISNPAKPSLVGSYYNSDFPTPSSNLPDTGTLGIGAYRYQPQYLKIVGNLAYIAGVFYGYSNGNLYGPIKKQLQIIDIANPQNPFLKGSYETLSPFDYASPDSTDMSVDIAGNKAYFFESYNKLHVIDISEPSSPQLVDIYEAPPSFTGYYGILDFEIEGRFGYAATDLGLKIIDLDQFGNSAGNSAPLGHELLERFARDTAYRTWEIGDDIDLDPDTKEELYFDSEYRVNQIWDDSKTLKADQFGESYTSGTGFYAIGLTSDNPENPPVLVIRGTEPTTVEDLLTDLDPKGIGYKQFKDNYEKSTANPSKQSIEHWLKFNGNDVLNPYITGHSLGAAISQYIGANYTNNGEKLGKIVTFNSPGIPLSETAKFKANNIEGVTHYVNAGDLVSIAGESFLGGEVKLVNYEDISSSVLFGKHFAPILVDRIERTGAIRPSEWKNDPEDNPITITAAELSNHNFSYYHYEPNTDYFVLNLILYGVGVGIAGVGGGILLGEQAKSRGSVEATRQLIGEAIHKINEELENNDKIELPNLTFAVNSDFFFPQEIIRLGKDITENSIFSLKAENVSLRFIEGTPDYALVNGTLTATTSLFNGIRGIDEDLTATANFTDSFAKVKKPGEYDKYIKITSKEIDLVGEFALENIIEIGDFALKELVVKLDTEKNKIKGEFELSLPLGFGIEAGAGWLQVPDSKEWELNEISAGVFDINKPIPLYPAVFFQSIEGELENFHENAKDPLKFGLKAGFTIGAKVQFTLPSWAGGTYNLALAEFSVKGELNKESLVTEGNISLLGGITTGTGRIELNWNEKYARGFINVEGLNGLISSLGGSFSINKNVDINLFGTGELVIPDISLFNRFAFGGITLASASTKVQYINDSTFSNDFIASWGRLPFIGNFGLRVYLNGSFGLIGAGEIDSINKQIANEITAESSTNFTLHSSDYLQVQNIDFPEIVNLALIEAQSTLSHFSNTAAPSKIFDMAFGNNWDQNLAEDLIQNWQAENFDSLPTISLIDTESINNANAAFADATNTIYLSREYLAARQHNPEAISEILLEEIGHWVDSQINAVDAAGDEGNIFSHLIINETISEEQLLKLQAEDDTVTVNLNGVLTELNLNTSVEDSFSIAAETPWIALVANWENVNNNVDIQLEAPDGTIYTEADIANSDIINIVEELSDSTHRIVHIEQPDAGNWTIRVPNISNLGNVELRALGGINSGNIEITSLEQDTDNNTVSINYQAFDVDSEAQISFFYDDDNEGYDGFIIADTVSENDGTGSFIWNTEGVPTGEYYLYAMLADDTSIPVFDYSSEKVQITTEADLSVIQTVDLESVSIAEQQTYTVKVTNNGEASSQGINLTYSLPEGATFVAATVNLLEQSDNNLTFELGDLAKGESATVEIRVHAPNIIGDSVSKAVVTSKTYDPDSANNLASLTTTITQSLPAQEDPSLNTPIYRFQSLNTSGTYLYAAGVEAENIRKNFTTSFVEEGIAFNTAIEPHDQLISLFRFQSNHLPGTYLFVGEDERNSINADPNLSNSFTEEGIGFYVYGVGANQGTDFYRFQNSNVPGTYLYATGAEADNIRKNFPNFIEEGIAFEVVI